MSALIAECRAVRLAEHAVQWVMEGPIRLKWYEIRLASIARLMVVTSNGPAPCIGRQLATAGTCAPMKIPVGLLRNACRSQPTRSKVSHAQVSSIRSCGSVITISFCDIPNRARSKSFSPSLRISPSQGLANRLGPENPPIGR